MRLGGGSITFSFFSERHIAAMPLDETILSVRWVAAALHFRSCLSHTSRVYCSMNRNCVFNVMHVRGGNICLQSGRHPIMPPGGCYIFFYKWILFFGPGSVSLPTEATLKVSTFSKEPLRKNSNFETRNLNGAIESWFVCRFRSSYFLPKKVVRIPSKSYVELLCMPKIHIGLSKFKYRPQIG